METTILTQTGLQLRNVVRDINSKNNSQSLSDSTKSDRVLRVEISQVSVHPKIKEVYIDKNTEGLKYTIKHVGQLEPIKVIFQDDQYQILDGVSRFKVIGELGLSTILVEVVDYSEDQIQEQFVYRNFRTKRSLKELLSHVDIVLGILGTSQGKKRETIGEVSLGDDDYCMVGKERFQICCEILGIDMSPTTLRRLYKLYEFDNEEKETKKTNFHFIDHIEKGELTINNGFDKLKIYEKEIEEEGVNQITELQEEQNIPYEGDNYTLFNKSCEDLSDIEDESVQCVVTSPPYYNMRSYKENSEVDQSVNESDSENTLEHGHESSVDEYVRKEVEIYSNVYKKLKQEGSLFIVISESYNKVSSLVIPKLIIEMCNNGWFLNSEIYWKKKSPKPHSSLKRLQPSYEKILHFVKDKDNFYYREFKNWIPGEKYGLQTGCNDQKVSGKIEEKKLTIKRPYRKLTDFLDEQEVTNVIESNGFRWDELEEVDKDFRHPGPYSEVVPIIPIITTTKIGDTVLDIFNGSSTTLSVSVKLRRKGIGYEINRKYHDFSIKRMKEVSKEENLLSNDDMVDFENQYLIEDPL